MDVDVEKVVDCPFKNETLYNTTIEQLQWIA